MTFEEVPNERWIGAQPGRFSEWVVGTDRLRGRPFAVPLPEGVAQHVTLVGVTGSGKTTTAEQLAQAAIGRGLPVVIVDAKGGGLRTAARVMAARCGEPYAELVPGVPDSLGYNPCAVGSRSQVADKLVSAFAYGPNAEIYRVIAQEAIAVLVGVLRALDEPVTVRRLRHELDRARMAGLAHRSRAVAPQLAADLAELGKRGGVHGEALEGMRARLGALLHGEYGELFEGEGEQLDLRDALTTSGVTYISLPALAVTKDTALMARVLIQDLKQAAHQRLQEPTSTPALLILDEFAALDDPDQVCDLLRQAREARVATAVSTQHLPDRATAYALHATLLGAGLLIAHRCGSDDAESVAAVIGTEKGVEVTRQVDSGANTGVGSVRRVDRYVVNPNAIKQLVTGDAVVLAAVGERRVATVRVASEPPARQATP
ncbi:MAG: type IV secretory system conjugative DNA transfer family protein [Candidatus Dormibacteria bacterium]